jgi:microcystin-dependent protein
MKNFEVENEINTYGSKGSFFKPGHVVSFTGSLVPDGWLVCDGSAISRTEYDNLFTAIGVVYGIGDGSTTFNIPDFSNRFLYIGTNVSGGSANHTHSVGANAAAQATSVNHSHSNFMTGYGGLTNNHNHSGASNIGYNGTNPVNANKTGTGGNGTANGGAHVHGAYSAAATNIHNAVAHGHNVASFGLNATTWSHSGHTVAISATSSQTSQSMPFYSVYFLVKT